MKKIKQILLFGTLFVLLDCLLVSGTALGIILYDYFSHRELLALYQSKYGLTLMLSLSFALSTMVCAVLFVLCAKRTKIAAWLKTHLKDYNDDYDFSYDSPSSAYREYISGTSPFYKF